MCAAANERSLTISTKYFPYLNLSADSFVHSSDIIRDFNTVKRSISSPSVEKPNENDYQLA